MIYVKEYHEYIGLMKDEHAFTTAILLDQSMNFQNTNYRSQDFYMKLILFLVTMCPGRTNFAQNYFNLLVESLLDHSWIKVQTKFYTLGVF